MSLQEATIPGDKLRSEDEVLDAARAFAAAIAPGAIDRDHERSHPEEELQQLAQTGLLTITVPARLGGLDVSVTTLVEMVRTLAVADPAIAQLALPHFVVSRFIREVGTPDQQQRFFANSLRGQRFGNATAERGTRTARDMSSRVADLGDGWVRIDGRKAYATGALKADWISVVGVTEDDSRVSVLVPGDAPGLEILEDWTSFGQKATISGTVIADAVTSPLENVLLIAEMFERPNLFAPIDQVTHAAVDVGIARAALIDAARFVRERSRPWPEAEVERLADEPHIVLRFGQLTTRLHAAEALLGRAAAAIDAALSVDPLTPEAVQRAAIAVDAAKAYGGEVSIELTSALFEVSGTASTDERLGLDRHWRNARAHTLHDPARWRYHHVGRDALDTLGTASEPDHDGR